MQPYSQRFYDETEDTSRPSAQVIVPLILQYIQPKSVVDIGCGTGVWLSAFKAHGVPDVLGVDGDYVDKNRLLIPKDKFIPFDLKEPFRTTRKFDLVVSLEVGEHINSNSADSFVDSLTRLGPVVLFSAAIPFQGGVNHINEQWQDYWAIRFRARGYIAIDCIRKKVWQNEDVQWWYSQNTLVYVQESELEKYPLLKQEVERTVQCQLSIVHPKLFLARADLKNMALRKLMARFPSLLVHAVKRTVKAICS